MIIKKVLVRNYKNLQDINFENDKNVKYIIGNNGVGKSNLLEAISSFFSKASFSAEDFFDENNPIEIELSLLLNEEELGYFDDFFSVDDQNEINIRAVQDGVDGRIEYYHIDSGSSISYQKIRTLSCVYYNSINAPEELNFIKTKTSGKFLNSLISKYIETNNLDVEALVDTNSVGQISDHLNELLNLINFIQNNKLEVSIERNILDLLPRLIELKNSDSISVNKMGSGVRYSSYIYFELLNKIMQAVERESNTIITTSAGKRYISMFVFLDEPEIHLHPFMQRSVIKDVRNIINNEDDQFLVLLKSIFNLDGIFGQLFVVTHSPNIISDNYREIIRLDCKKKQVVAYSGSNFVIPNSRYEKHFLLHNMQIKEAFFSKAVIICEGVTERTSIGYFAERMRIDLDGKGIGIIGADGAGTIVILRDLLKEFGIRAICIIDKDKFDASYIDVYYTEYCFFEHDFIQNIFANHRIHVLCKIIRSFGDNLTHMVQKDAINKVSKKIGSAKTVTRNYTLKEALTDTDVDIKLIVPLTWLYYIKEAIIGKVISENIEVCDIPYIYKKIILKADKVANE